MAITEMERIPNQMRTCIICIDSYDGGAIKGRIFHPCFSKPFQFDNVMALLKTLEMLYDMFEYPQASTRRRSFFAQSDFLEQSKKENLPRKVQPFLYEMSENFKIVGRVATLQLRVIFRQNASWQGSIQWIEKNKKENFRSCLELMMLIDSIFEITGQMMHLNINSYMKEKVM